MNTKWYYVRNNQAQGPVSQEFLMDGIAKGDIQLFDLVFIEGSSQWRTVAEYPELRGNSGSNSLMDSQLGDEKEWVLLKVVNASTGQYRQDGPFSTSEISTLVHSGTITFSDYVWKPGFSKWTRLAELKEFDRRTNRGPELPPLPEEEIWTSTDALAKVIRLEVKSAEVAETIPEEAKPPPVTPPDPPPKPAYTSTAFEPKVTAVAPPAPRYSRGARMAFAAGLAVIVSMVAYKGLQVQAPKPHRDTASTKAPEHQPPAGADTKVQPPTPPPQAAGQQPPANLATSPTVPANVATAPTLPSPSATGTASTETKAPSETRAPAETTMPGAQAPTITSAPAATDATQTPTPTTTVTGTATATETATAAGTATATAPGTATAPQGSPTTLPPTDSPLEIVPLNLDGENPQLVFQTSVPPNEPMEVWLKGRTGRILQLASFQTALKIQREPGEIPTLDLADLNLPRGWYNVQVKAGDKIAKTTIFIGTEDKDFHHKLDRHRKQIAFAQQEERSELYRLEKGFSAQWQELMDHYKKDNHSPRAWHKFFAEWTKHWQGLNSKRLEISVATRNNYAFPELWWDLKGLRAKMASEATTMDQNVMSKRAPASVSDSGLQKKMQAVLKRTTRLSAWR